MPEVRIDVLTETAKTLEELSEHLARVQKEIRYLLGGNIDADNIIAKSITAGLINVDQLSAISANLGHITAGLIEAVTIYGSTIATSESDYPRAEMSNTNKLFKVSTSPTNYAQFEADAESEFGVAPALTFFKGTDRLEIGPNAVVGGYMGIYANNGLIIFAFNGVSIPYFEVNSWGNMTSSTTNRTMQQELDDIWAAIYALQP